MVQVLTVIDPWDESTINWNYALLAFENTSMARKDPRTVAGVPRVWDVSYAVKQAYQFNVDFHLHCIRLMEITTRSVTLIPLI